MTMTNTTATTASAYKKLTSLSDHDKCNNFLMDIKNKFRGTNMTETVDGEKTIRGNLARLLTARVYPNAGGEMRTGTETISAPDNLGGDWGEDLAEQAEEIAWTFAYEMLGDELRARMSVRFDRDASTPDGSAFLRLVLSKTGMADPTAHDLKTKKDFGEHIKTNMPDDVSTEGMETWIDTMVKLNLAKFRPDGSLELVQHVLVAFPPDLGALMNAATERVDDTIEMDDMKAIWSATLERHILRQQRHADTGGRAMAARGTDFTALQAQVAHLTALLQSSESAAAVAAAAYPRPGHAKCPPKPEGCGRMHAGGLADCWFLHPGNVPDRMGFMLHGIHRDRAANKLPDVSAKYPATEVGRGAARPARAAAVRVISDVPDPAFAMRACVQVGDKPCLADPTPPVEELHARFTEELRAVEELNVNVTEELVGEYRRVPVTLLPRRTHRQNKQTKHCGGGAFLHSVNRVRL